MPEIVPSVIPESEYTITAVRSSGPGGQHVNKVSTAIVLRFDIHASSLPDEIKARFLSKNDNRISGEGIVTIKSGTHRSQMRNKQAAIAKLHTLLNEASIVPKKRKRTKPTKDAIVKKREAKERRSDIKSMRKRINY